MRAALRPLLLALAGTLTITGAPVALGLLDAGTATAATSYAGLRLNEVDANASTDWIELTNTGTSALDLSGLDILDSDSSHGFQTVPSGTTLAPGSFLAVDVTAFGLDKDTDSVRLYPAGTAAHPSGSVATLDSYSWTKAASYSYGRCADGTGAVTATTAATKGAANACPASAWPGGTSVSTVDQAKFFGTNLSGLAYQGSGSTTPGTLWAVKNGPSTLYKVVKSGSSWVAASGDWAQGKSLRYEGGSGDPDAEGVTFTSTGPSAGIFVSTERDNDKSGTSRPAVLEFKPDTSGTTLTAVRDWNLTPDLPGLDPNGSLEGITWVPDSYLTAHGLVDRTTGRAYQPSAYPDHGSGLFLVAVEQTGKIYAYELNQSADTFTQIAVFASGFPAVADLHWNAERQNLWVVCDDTCNGQISTFTVHGGGAFARDATYARPSGASNYNNEGFTIAASSECVGGTEPTFYSDDSDDGDHALRSGTVNCTGS